MIISLYAGLLALVFASLTIDTIRARRRNGISIGVGDDRQIERIVAGHANFTSYAIFLLFLLYLAEVSNLIPALILHIIGIAFTLGRILHYLAFRGDGQNVTFRVVGMHLTIWPLILLGLINLAIFVIAFF